MEKRFKGCILWAMCGDVIGSAVEGARSDYVISIYPDGLTDFKNVGRGYGKYTDDSQMMLALCKSLVRNNNACDAADCSRQYAEDFQIFRGYGSGVSKILMDLQVTNDSTLYRKIATKYFLEGSWGNGGVMRIAPIGLCYQADSLLHLQQAVKDALLCTHVHPLAIDAAFVQAAAVRWLLNVHVEFFDTNMFLEYLEMLCQTEELSEKITLIKDTYKQVKIVSWKDHFVTDEWHRELELAKQVTSDWFQLKATDALSTALLAFVTHWHEPINMFAAICAYGGDTDTVCCIAGALVGALWGSDNIPRHWLDCLEDHDLAVSLAEEMFKVSSL